MRHVERYRTVIVVTAVLVGGLLGWFIGGGDWSTLQTIVNDPDAVDAMSDEELGTLILPMIIGAIALPWLVNRWFEHRASNNQ
jgi:hypothetical protein